MIKLCAFSDEAASDLHGQIAALLENNIHLMELRSVGGRNVADLSEDEARETAKALSQNGIAVWSVGSPIGKVTVDTDRGAYMQKLRHVCRLAGIFGAKRVRIFSFFDAYEKKQLVFSLLREMVAIAAEYDLLLCHENEKLVFGDTVARVLELLDAVSGLGAVYDPANFLQVGENATKSLDALHHRADYFHIKDVIVKSDELVPAGEGDGQIDELIRRIDRDAVLTLEPHLAMFDAYRQIDESEMRGKHVYENGRVAFDAATKALKDLLTAEGYRETKEGFVK